MTRSKPSTTRGTLRIAIALVVSLLATSSVAAPAGTKIFDFADLASRTSDAVVNIQIKAKAAEEGDDEQSGSGANPGEMFRRFFEGFPGYENAPRRPSPANSKGSGFIYDDDGYIITNNHVVQGGGLIEVSLADRRVFEAELVGADPRSDIAVIKIDAKDLPVARIGDSSRVKVGEWVMAIGSPFGFDHTVTKGIISAKQRSLPADSYVPFFQTDVPLNPGNSGGPLYNLEGEVVGVNSQIYSRTGSFAGISFAIPINLAMSVARQLRDDGKVVRGWLGVTIQEVTSELADSFSTGRPHGALVSKVLPGSPASEGGLKVGDIIHKFEGEAVNRSGELPPMVGAHPVGTEATVEILRRGKPLRLRVKIGELPEEKELADLNQSSPAGAASARASHSFAGLVFEDLSEAESGKLNIDAGVKVSKVSAAGQAARSGFRVGDVVTSVSGETVEDIEDLKEAIEDADKGSYLAFLVSRGGQTIFLTLKKPA